MIHPILAAGLTAYETGDFRGALIAWEEPWKELDPQLDPVQRDLALALIRLAGALHHEQGGRRDSSGQLYASAQETLDGLPAHTLGVDVERLRRTWPATAAAALASPPRITAARRLPPRRVVLRFLLLVALLAGGFAAFRWTPLSGLLNQEALSELLGGLRQAWWSPLALIALYIVLSTLGLPATPLIFAGGFVFGAFFGGIYNYVGTFLGAAASYHLGHLLGRDMVVHLAGKRLKRVEKMLARQGFWTLFRIRFLPVPFPVVNYGAALAGFPAPTFHAANAVGLAPVVFLYTWFAAALGNAAEGERGAVLVRLTLTFLAVVGVTLLPTLLRARTRRRRYREILEHRRGRR